MTDNVLAEFTHNGKRYAVVPCGRGTYDTSPPFAVVEVPNEQLYLVLQEGKNGLDWCAITHNPEGFLKENPYDGALFVVPLTMHRN